MEISQETLSELKKKIGSSDFPSSERLRLSPKEDEVFRVAVKFGISTGDLPNLPGLTKHLLAAGYNNNHTQLLKARGVLDNSANRNQWSFTSKTMKFLVGDQVGATSSAGSPTEESLPEPSPPLEGKFKELWDWLVQKRSGREIILKKEGVEEAAKTLSPNQRPTDSQWVWDTLRKFESRGLVKRTGRKDGGIVFVFLAMTNHPTKSKVTVVTEVKAVPAPALAAPTATAAPPVQVASKPTKKGNLGLQQFGEVIREELSGLDAQIESHETLLVQLRKSREQKLATLTEIQNHL